MSWDPWRSAPPPAPTFTDLLLKGLKRKVFVSYHHGSKEQPGDQLWADYFRILFGESYEVFVDHSLDERIGSYNLTYVDRKIREDWIEGSSVTIVLCGANTWKRKCVDWEIYGTLYDEHALLGIALPTAIKAADGSVTAPARLHDNVQSGYAHFIHWTEDPGVLKAAIDKAYELSGKKSLIRNGAQKMERNRP